MKSRTVIAAGSTRMCVVHSVIEPGMLQRSIGSVLRIQKVETDTKLGVSIRSVLILAGHIVRVLVLFVTSSFGTLCVEQTEAIGKRSFLDLVLGSYQGQRCHPALGYRNITFIVEEPDLAALVLHPRHHARARKRGVADRVCVEVSVVTTELDIDNDEIRDMLHVVT